MPVTTSIGAMSLNATFLLTGVKTSRGSQSDINFSCGVDILRDHVLVLKSFPLLLVLGARFQDAASQDVGEQLVAGLLKGGGGGHSARFRTFLGHAAGCSSLVRTGDWESADQSAPQCNRARETAQRAEVHRPCAWDA